VSPRIALSFDDGPAQWTPAILDLLAAAGARATFFVLGQSIDGNEDVLRRIPAEGHELGNHGYSHRDARKLTDEEIAEELRSTADRISALGLEPPRLVRPPYGEGADRVARVAREIGAGRVVLWTIDPKDWRSDADTIVETVLDEAFDGAIVDLHDGRPRADSSSSKTREATVEAVGRLLEELAGWGYEFVTAGELA
jgi:peptidoglycan/xylan/chitin deacetylase (PgdA/CDA1 family)